MDESCEGEKFYTIYDFENQENSTFKLYNVKPVMMIAGNYEISKELVSRLNTDLGCDTLDTGNLSQSLHLEHLTLLWVKTTRINEHHPNFIWAYLER